MKTIYLSQLLEALPTHQFYEGFQPDDVLKQILVHEFSPTVKSGEARDITLQINEEDITVVMDKQLDLRPRHGNHLTLDMRTLHGAALLENLHKLTIHAHNLEPMGRGGMAKAGRSQYQLHYNNDNAQFDCKLNDAKLIKSYFDDAFPLPAAPLKNHIISFFGKSQTTPDTDCRGAYYVEYPNGSKRFIAPYVEGKDLNFLMRNTDALNARGTLEWIAFCLFITLCKLHARGMVHRDIKAENIVFNAELRLIDPDTCAIAQEQQEGIAGTLTHIPIELITLPAAKKTDKHLYGADVYAAAIVLIQLINDSKKLRNYFDKMAKSLPQCYFKLIAAINRSRQPNADSNALIVALQEDFTEKMSLLKNTFLTLAMESPASYQSIAKVLIPCFTEHTDLQTLDARNMLHAMLMQNNAMLKMAVEHFMPDYSTDHANINALFGMYAPARDKEGKYRRQLIDAVMAISIENITHDDFAARIKEVNEGLTCKKLIKRRAEASASPSLTTNVSRIPSPTQENKPALIQQQPEQKAPRHGSQFHVERSAPSLQPLSNITLEHRNDP